MPGSLAPAKLVCQLWHQGESTAKTAPQPLYLVQRFVNSIDLESGEDELPAPRRCATVRRARPDGQRRRGRPRRPQAGDRRPRGPARRAASQQRPPARHGARSGSTGPSGAPACACASRAAATPSSCPTCRGRGRRGGAPDGDRGRRGGARPLGAALACPREECEWAFYDKSKNRSGRWCSMESCGNIEKAKAFRERQRR